MDQKVRVLFYLQNLSGGGVERVHTELFRSYDQKKFVYKLFLKDSQLVDYHNSVRPSDLFYVKPSLIRSLHPEVFLQFLCLRLPYSVAVRALLYLYRKVVIQKRIRNTVCKYFSSSAIAKSLYQEIIEFYFIHWRAVFLLNQAIVDYQPHILIGALTESSNALIFLSRQTLPVAHRNIRWIATEHNNTVRRFADYYESEQEEFWNRFARVIFANAHKIITPSEGVKNGLVRYYQVNSSKIAVIHNPVDNASIHQSKPVEMTHPFVMSAGRLHSQKGLERLIRSFTKISNAVDVHLYILGKGKLEPELKALVQVLHSASKVHFLGFQPNLWSYMKAARLFVLSSRYEGLGNVLIEAMACGCPVVSFDCDYGPSEIIQHGENGLLVATGNEEELAEAMLRVLGDDEFRQRLSVSGAKRALDFDTPKIAQQYEELFLEMYWDP